MGHKTLINGTAYEISGGRTLVNGTNYTISNGRTLIGGTGYNISFSKAPEYVLLASGTTRNSAIQGTAILPANTVAVVGEAHRYLNAGQDQTFGGLAPYYNGSWIRPYGSGFPITGRVDFSISGNTVTYNIPGLAATNGPYYVYAVVSKKATWHTTSVWVGKNSGGTIYNPVPDNFICVIGNVSTLIASNGPWYQSAGSFSAFWCPMGTKAVMNQFRGDDRCAAWGFGYYGFYWTDAAGIGVGGDGDSSYTLVCQALYVD